MVLFFFSICVHQTIVSQMECTEYHKTVSKYSIYVIPFFFAINVYSDKVMMTCMASIKSAVKVQDSRFMTSPDLSLTAAAAAAW